MAGNAVVGALRVTLGLDSAAFENGLTDAQKRMKDVGGRLKSVGATIAKVGVGISVAMAGAATAAGAAVNKITSDLVDLAAEAKTAGMSFEGFQQWQYIAGQARVSVEALTDGIKEMQLRADEFAATGGGSAAEAFQRIGLSGAELTEALKNPSAMFDDILQRIGKLDTAAQIRVADEIFGGTGGEQFVRLLDLGSDGIARLKEQFITDGGLIPEAQVKKAAEFQQAIDRVKAAFSGMATNALMDSGLVEWLTQAIPEALKFSKTVRAAIEPTMQSLSKGVAEVMPWLKSLGDALVASLGPMIPPLMKAVQSAIAALMPVVVEVSKALIDGFGPILLTALRAVAATVTSVFSIVGQALRVIGALLKGDWSGAWNAAGSLVMETVRSVGRIIEAIFPGIGENVRKMVQGVAQWLTGRLFDVLNGVISKVKTVSDAFFKLYDAVVGHSYVPDMVEGIAVWMAKLDAGMVQPARNATAAAKDAFQKLRDDVAVIMEGLLTDAERNAREVASKIAKIREAAAAGVISEDEAAQAEGGVWGAGLAMPEGIKLDPSKPLIDPAAMESLKSLGATASQISAPMQQALGGILDATRSLTDGLVDLALTGQGSLADLLMSFVATVAKIIVEMLALKAIEMATGIPVSAMIGGGTGGGVGDFFGNLLGFKNGGSFEVGGAGSVDSKLVAFRATPGERVDISTPRQQRQQGGGNFLLHVAPSPYFDARVEQVAGPMVAQGVAAGAGAVKRDVFDTLYRQQTYSRRVKV